MQTLPNPGAWIGFGSSVAAAAGVLAVGARGAGNNNNIASAPLVCVVVS